MYVKPLASYFSQGTPTKLYHYTGVGALHGMALHKKLWATHIYYLNDSKELLHAVELMLDALDSIWLIAPNEKSDFAGHLNTWLKDLPRRPFDLFVFSLSEEENLLSQWRSYTPHGKGVCIDFPEWTLQNLIYQNGLKLGKCLYEKTEHSELLLALVEFLWNLFAKLPAKPTVYDEYATYFSSHRVTILETLALVKHKAFSEEKEWRLIKCSEHTEDEIFYREGPTMLIPYSQLALDEGGKWFGTIRLGPSEHPELAISSLGRFTSQYRLCQSVIPSYIPYRKL